MPIRLRDISTGVTFLTLLLMLVMGSGVVVYCVGADDHEAIELVHGDHPCDEPMEGGGDSSGLQCAIDMCADAPCVDQTVSEKALPPIVLSSSDLAVTAPASLHYELPSLVELQASNSFTRWRDTPAPPDISVVRSVILLI